MVILPTASAPDGPGVPERWAEMGVRHFERIGASATAVLALRREDCLQADLAKTVRHADLVYFPGGKPGYLWSAISGTPVWHAVVDVLERGGVVAGCSAGAMILGGWIAGRFSWRRRTFLQPAAGLVEDCVVLPHFDELPDWAGSVARWLIPARITMIGVDGGTALVGRGDTWQVLGRGGVLVAGGRSRKTFRAGDRLRLRMPAA